jgi:hypothetical protein
MSAGRLPHRIACFTVAAAVLMLALLLPMFAYSAADIPDGHPQQLVGRWRSNASWQSRVVLSLDADGSFTGQISGSPYCLPF